MSSPKTKTQKMQSEIDKLLTHAKSLRYPYTIYDFDYASLNEAVAVNSKYHNFTDIELKVVNDQDGNYFLKVTSKKGIKFELTIDMGTVLHRIKLMEAVKQFLKINPLG